MVELVIGVIANAIAPYYQKDHDSHVVIPTTEKGLRGYASQ